MIAMIPILAFITVGLLVWALTNPSGESAEVRLRKHGYLPNSRQIVNLDRPFSERVVSPVIGGMGSLVTRVTPDRMQRRIREKLDQAHVNMKPTNFLVFMGLLAIGLPAMMILPAIRNGTFGFQQILLGGAFMFLGLRMPEFWLSRKITDRQEKIRKSLPDALDLITICVEAGYGLDAALARVAEKVGGPLAEELSHMLAEVNLGKPRSQALRDMAQKVKVPDLQSFIATIIQAEQMGVSIASILRVQSDSMRVKRRQHAEEEAMKAPVKMLFPLVFLILPSLFVVVLGPAMIRIMDFFTRHVG